MQEQLTPVLGFQEKSKKILLLSVKLELVARRYKHTYVLISKRSVFSSGVSLGIKTHPPDQNRHHLLSGHFMNC